MAAKMSLAVLGGVLGISYQQMQKYESGRDRVSASALAAIAAALGVHPGSFFSDETPSSGTDATPAPRSTVSDLRGAQRLGERIMRLRDPTVVRRLASFIDALVDEQD